MKKNKKIIIGIIIAILVILSTIFLTRYIILYNINKNKVNELYGIVKNINSDSIDIEPTNSDIKLINIKTTDKYNVGDFILITYKGDINDGNTNIELIMENTSDIIVVEEETTDIYEEIKKLEEKGFEVDVYSGKDMYYTITKIYTGDTTTSTTIANTTTTTISNDDLLNTIKGETEEITSSSDTTTYKEKAKNVFITLVDFIFYDGEIKGKKFSDLTTTAKAKVIFYALKLDGWIDSKIPDYKETLSSKYSDAKSKLLAKYLDFTVDICSEHPDECEVTKNDFNILKTSLNLTWDVLKKAFSYAYDFSIPRLQAWYQTFKGE